MNEKRIGDLEEQYRQKQGYYQIKKIKINKLFIYNKMNVYFLFNIKRNIGYNRANS